MDTQTTYPADTDLPVTVEKLYRYLGVGESITIHRTEQTLVVSADGNDPEYWAMMLTPCKD